MQKNREVIKYAKALYDVSNKSKCIEQTSKNLKKIFSIYSSSSQFRLFLQSRRIGNKEKTEIINNILLNVVSPLELDLLIDLVENNNINLLYSIIKQFNAICDRNIKNVKVTLTTVLKLQSEVELQILNSIKKKINKNINFDSIVEPSILGGAKIRIGNLIIDGSISTRLEKLKKTFYER